MLLFINNRPLHTRKPPYTLCASRKGSLEGQLSSSLSQTASSCVSVVANIARGSMVANVARGSMVPVVAGSWIALTHGLLLVVSPTGAGSYSGLPSHKSFFLLPLDLFFPFLSKGNNPLPRNLSRYRWYVATLAT